MNTIQFPENAKSSLTLVRSPTRRRCNHSSLVLDAHTRTIKCELCSCVIEPFDYLVMVAEKECRLRSESRALKHEIQQKMMELSEVKRQLANAKARLNRA
ncbi:hypothetical protein, partial [Shewanella sp. YQ_9]